MEVNDRLLSNAEAIGTVSLGSKAALQKSHNDYKNAVSQYKPEEFTEVGNILTKLEAEFKQSSEQIHCR